MERIVHYAVYIGAMLLLLYMTQPHFNEEPAPGGSRITNGESK